ncbi:MAG: putative 2-aminoethylphosphonate ABC transporter permease subunit [Alphaproteobacteria bacterium]|nr:putative 2-aminoethylphosphonate ABC transporter permease subunit [Alphaproteobacteria bacterium]
MRRRRLGASRDDLIMRLGLGVGFLLLTLTVVAPLATLLVKAFQDRAGGFVGLANFLAYAESPALLRSLHHSLFVALLATAICVTLAFAFAWCLTRSCMPAKGLFRAVALVPILAPSLLPAISLVYLFGNQGLLKGLLFGASIYGPIGIVMGEVFWTFPHALIILLTAFATADQRLYEAAESLRAGRLRTFFAVTLPGVRYGLISAAFVVFTLVITDFGVPKVIGGHYNVLATDVYKQVIGQQNFQMGAVVGLILLVPAALAFVADRFAAGRQVALLGARSVPLAPKPSPAVDAAAALFCTAVAVVIVGIIAVAAFAASIKLWPYDLSFTLGHFDFDNVDGGGWGSYRNSLTLAGWSALLGSLFVFTLAFLVEKTRGLRWLGAATQLLALLPLAVPGIVLGLAYIFFFNAPANPLGAIYGTMAILVLNTIVHFYAVAHLTAITQLKQLDPEFETVAVSLKVPIWRSFLSVTLPVSLPTVFEIALYLFVNAMTTVSGVVFLYSPDTTLASVAVLNMDDAGDTAPAAAMALLIFTTSAAVRIVHTLVTRGLLARTQAWRRRITEAPREA